TLSHSAEDAALLLNAMAGKDLRDSTSMDNVCGDLTAQLEQPLTGLKIGLPEEFFNPQLNGDIAALIEAAVKQLEALGAVIKAVRLPNNHLSIPAYYVIAPAEASANLSRFDGVRYGYRCNHPEDLQDLYLRSRSE